MQVHGISSATRANENVVPLNSHIFGSVGNMVLIEVFSKKLLKMVIKIAQYTKGCIVL